MIKIAITGPESTGKSMLSVALAKTFNGIVIPELAREYIEHLSEPYTFADVSKIAQMQIDQELEIEQQNKKGLDFVFFDTDLIITKVWFKHRFGEVPDFLTERMKKPYIDFHLLCSPDLEWIPDPVREHGTDRDYFFNWYETEIQQTNKPYSIIQGIGEQRLNNAVNAIHDFLQNYIKQ